MTNIYKLSKEDHMDKILEYIAHPISALRAVHNFYREPVVQNSFSKGSSINPHRTAHNVMHDYFRALHDYNRIQLYATYVEIEQDPLIGRVLDAYAGACTQFNTDTSGVEAGRAVWLYSANKDIENILYKFLDTHALDENTFAMLRTMYHLGDHFEYLPANQDQGIISLLPYEPWELACCFDESRKVSAYSHADNEGKPVDATNSVPYYSVAHFRMPNRKRTAWYGSECSLLFNIREYWQELQWCWDKILIERLRRSDKEMITLDVGGMSTEDAFLACKEWQERMYQTLYSNPETGEMLTSPAAWGEMRAFVIPTCGDNRTSISHVSAGNVASLDDANMIMARLFAVLNFPAGYLGLDLGGSYDRKESLAKQDVGFSTACIRPQHAFLKTLATILETHLAWHNINTRDPQNSFVLMMQPVSVYQELERKELLALRFDLLDRALSLGKEHEWNSEFWTKHVMTEYAQFTPSMVEKLLQKPPEEPKEEIGQAMDTLESIENEEKERMEVFSLLESRPRSKKAIELLRDGGASAVVSSSNFYLPKDINPVELSNLVENSTTKSFIKNLVIERCKKRYAGISEKTYA
jgi:hypothetical protein